MEKDARYFAVGLFVTISIFAVVGFLIWLMGPHDKKDLKFYTVEFSDSVSGLEEGASVHYHGLRVGKVMAMNLAPESFDLVRVDIGVEKYVPVRGQTKVTLEVEGITGLVRLEMATEETDTTLPPAKAGAKYPVLAGTGTQLYKMLSDLPAITADVREMTKKLNNMISRDMNGLLSPMNVGNASLLLSNLTTTSAQIPEMVDHLKNMSNEMDAAAGSFNEMLRKNRPSIDRFATHGLSGISSATREIRGTAASARRLTTKLEADPSQVIYQPSRHGVEIPK